MVTKSEGESRQGDFFPVLGRDDVKKTEVLSKEELTSRANRVLLLYAEKAIYPLYDKVRRGEGKQVLSTTEEGRPGEELLDIDQTGENVLKAAIREAKLPAILISENSPEPHVFGNGDSEKLYVFTDPFDNTSQYKRGLDTPPYTVVSIFDKEGNPIGAVVGDIKDRKAYMSLGKEAFIIDIKDKIYEVEKHTKDTIAFAEKFIGTGTALEEYKERLKQFEKEFEEKQQRAEHKRRPISKSERTTLRDKDSTLASYTGQNEYSSKFFQYFGKLKDNMHPKGILYGGGGAYIYGLLASGAVDAYVMFDEPMSEIIPGVPLALAAGCSVVSVNEDGSFEDFKFDPNTLRENHKLYSEGSIPLFVAAATPEIRDEIIKYYLEAKSRTGNISTNIFKSTQATIN
jgi:fructose-1,6-bisphosphatase/inositol monophosphatase family enzyme